MEAPQESQPKEEVEEARNRSSSPRKIKTMLILLTVGRKLIGNPNTHATIIGLVWACIKFRLANKKQVKIFRIMFLINNDVFIKKNGSELLNSESVVDGKWSCQQLLINQLQYSQVEDLAWQCSA